MIHQLLWNSFWQGMIIVCITWFATRLISERNATTRYALWFTALLAIVLLPLATQFSSLGVTLQQWLVQPQAVGDGGVTISLHAITNLTSDVATKTPSFWWCFEIAWVAGVVVQLMRLAVSLFRLTSLRAQTQPLPELGGDVLSSSRIDVPIVAGFARPRVLLPSAIASSLAPADLTMIIEHERAHIRRGDLYANLIQRIIETLLWFNPAVHVICHYLVRERECACDDWAVRERVSTDYAACLAQLATRNLQQPTPLLTPSAIGSDSTLLQRVRRLTRGGQPNLTLNYYALGGIVITLIVLSLAIQALTPAESNAAAIQVNDHPTQTVASAGCSTPNEEARILNPVPPKEPRGAKRGTVDLVVKVSAKGTPTSIMIQHVTKDLPSKQVLSVLNAARESTYAPARHNCLAVSGTYIFHADFEPAL